MRLNDRRILAVLLLIYFYAVFIRIQGFDSALNQSYPIYYSEGASHYHFTKTLVEGGFLPSVDDALQYPEGFMVFSRTPTLLYYLTAVYALVSAKLGLGFYAPLLLLMPLLYCISVFTVYAITKILTGQSTPALVSAALYGVSMSSVGRSTLHFFIYENMTLPLIFLHIFLLVKSLNSRTPGKTILFAALSGLFLFTSLGAWFATGFYFTVLILCFTLIYFTGGRRDFRLYSVFGTQVLFVLAAYIMFPHLPFNPIQLGLAYALVALVLLSQYARLSAKKAVFAYIVLAVLFVLPAQSNPDFSHVYSVFYNKIIHLNRWSSEMPYEVRLTWVSGYDAPPLSRILSLLTLLPAGLFVLARELQRAYNRYSTPPQNKLMFLLSLAYLSLSLLAVRLFVFLVFFLSLLSGILAYKALKSFPHKRKTLLLVISGLVFVEAGLGYALTVGSSGGLHPDVSGMLDYVNQTTAKDDIVLSSYFESPMIHAYTGRRVLLNPFWENKGLRRKVAFFDHILFEGEVEYHEIISLYGVDYIVYNRGICEGAPRFAGIPLIEGSFIKAMCDQNLNESLFSADEGNPSYFLIKAL